MSKIKLWSYGDSHAAGHELGTDYSEDVGKSWIRSIGYKDRSDARNQLGVDKYNKLVKQKWYQAINHLCTPSLSYAGQLATLLDYELINRATPGSSNSLNILKMYQDLSKWSNDDVILFSVVTPFRFIPGNDINNTNHQVHWLPKKIANVLWNDGPHEVCFRLQTHGYLHMAKNLHKNVYTLQTVPDDISVEGITPAFDIQLSFTEFVKNNYDIESLRYPGGHLHEDVHITYAEYIYNTWNR
mgnify:CR=1 FL=1